MDAKSIFIVVIILILLYYIVSTFLTSSGLTSMSGAEEQLTVPSSKLKSGGASNSAYSIWFYVDDWSKNYGEEKVVFQRVNASDEGLKVALGSHTNDLIVTLDQNPTTTTTNNNSGNSGGNEYIGELSGLAGASNCNPTEGTQPYTDSVNCIGDDGNGNTNISYYVANNALTLNGHPIPQPNGNAKLCNVVPDNYYANPDCPPTSGSSSSSTPSTSTSGTSSTSTSTPSTSTSGSSAFTLLSSSTIEGMSSSTTSKHTCTVKNVPIQKWVNVIVSFNNRTLDIYMNGKLVKTCYMDEPPEISASDDVVISPTGKTFSGMTSKFKFWNTSMDPQKAWYTYSDGFAPGLGLASFFNKYKFKMALLENNIETTSVTI